MHELPAPKDPRQPWPRAGAAFVNAGRSSRKTLLLAIATLVVVTAIAGSGAIWPEEVLTGVDLDTGRVISGVIAAAFGLPLVLCPFLLPHMLRTHGLAVDQSGVWYVDRSGAVPFAWAQIRAVGGSFRWKRRAQTPGRRSRIVWVRAFFTVEVFPHDPRTAGNHAELAGMLDRTERERPPRPDLPSARLRVFFRGHGDYNAITTHLQQRAPQLWIGEYERERFM